MKMKTCIFAYEREAADKTCIAPNDMTKVEKDLYRRCLDRVNSGCNEAVCHILSEQGLNPILLTRLRQAAGIYSRKSLIAAALVKHKRATQKRGNPGCKKLK